MHDQVFKRWCKCCCSIKVALNAWLQGAAGWESDEDDVDATKMDQDMELWQTRRDEADAAAAAVADASGAGAAPEAGAGPLSADAADPGVADTSDERKHKMEAQAARANDGLDMFAEQVQLLKPSCSMAGLPRLYS